MIGIQIAVMGASGSGKTTSFFKDPELGIKGVPMKEIFYISPLDKIIFTDGEPLVNVHKGKSGKLEGNRFTYNSLSEYVQGLNYALSLDQRFILIEDLSNGLQIEQSKGLGDTWTVAKETILKMHMADAVLRKLKAQGKIIIISGLYETEMISGKTTYKFKMPGKALYQRYDIPSLSEIVLFYNVDEEGNHSIITGNNGIYPARSKRGIFPEKEMPCDMGVILGCVTTFLEKYENKSK